MSPWPGVDACGARGVRASPAARGGSLWALLGVMVLGGCASLLPAGSAADGAAATSRSASTEALASSSAAESEASASASSPASGAGALRLTIDAPDELATLLRRHLDLARLARDAKPDSLSDYELRRVEAAAPAQARALLETEGYFNAKVRLERTAGDPVVVNIVVEPGPRAMVERLKFEVQGDLERRAARGDGTARITLEALRNDWPMKPGTPFRNQRWVDAKTAALARLRAEGYAAAAWSGTAAEVDANADEVNLTLILDSGPRYHLGELRIEGLERHEQATVRNLAGFVQGAPATEATLLDYQERLVRTGLFDRASVTLDTDNADPAGTPVIVRVGEAPLQQATTGLGFSANTGPRVSFEHTHRRAFGERATLRNKAEIGRLRQAWEGELSSHAQPDLYRNILGGTFERLVAQDDSDVVRSARARLGRTRETTRREHFTFVQVERTDRETATTKDAITAASLNHHAIWRDVDSVLLPTKGASLSLQTGAGYARGDTDRGPYGRLAARIGVWQPLPGNWYGQARFELGQVFVRDDLPVPQTQLFRAGGDESVRGYPYRSLGPQVNGVVGGGRVLFTSSVEVARPISERLPSVWWAVFADAGQAANRWSDLKPAWGAGVGVRWRSPVGPLSIDWAWGGELRRSRLHLSVGIVF